MVPSSGFLGFVTSELLNLQRGFLFSVESFVAFTA